ncbi:MAG: hypothetical protein IJF14_03730 [Clostridia bacterium]|nr:hypothetical protein [Clostridia bacterium]
MKLFACVWLGGVYVVFLVAVCIVAVALAVDGDEGLVLPPAADVVGCAAVLVPIVVGAPAVLVPVVVGKLG